MKVEALSRVDLQALKVGGQAHLASRDAQAAQGGALLLIVEGVSGRVGRLHHHQLLLALEVGSPRQVHADLWGMHAAKGPQHTKSMGEKKAERTKREKKKRRRRGKGVESNKNKERRKKEGRRRGGEKRGREEERRKRMMEQEPDKKKK